MASISCAAEKSKKSGCCFPVHARRVSDTPQLGGSLFHGSRFVVHTSCVSNTPFPGWGSFALCGARERCAAPALGQKGRDTYGFPPSLNSYLSLSSLANEPYGSTS